MFSKNLFNKDDLNVRVSVYGKNPKYQMIVAYKEAWIKRICEALDESNNYTPFSTGLYHPLNYAGNYYSFRNSIKYTIQYLDYETVVSTTLSDVKGSELIAYIENTFKIPKDIRIDSDYCSWIILIPN